MAKKILVVDDEQAIVDLLHKFLSKEGFEVLTSTDGSAALGLAQKFLPDLILLDVMMPGMDGGEVMEGLLEDKKLKDIPVIFLTGAISQDETIVQDKKSTGRLFMSKGGDMREQIKVIKKILMAVVVLFFGTLLLPSSVLAQEEGDWDPLSAGPATTWTAPLMEKGKLAVQPFVYYNRTRGSFDDDGHYASLPSGDKQSQFQQYIFSQYGITDKWEVAAQVVSQQNYLTQGGVKAHHQGLGDSYVYTRYKLAEEKSWLPETTGLLQLKVPTGKYQHEDPDKLGTDLMGTGSWDPGVGLNFTKRLKPFMFHGDVIVNFPQEVRVNGVKTQYANYFNYDVAVDYFLPKNFNLMLEVNGTVQGDQTDDGEKMPATDSSSLVFSPGVGWFNDRIQVMVAYQRTLLGANTDANDAVMATFVYTF